MAIVVAVMESSVSDAAKIVNMVMTDNDRRWREMKSVWRKTVSSQI